MRGSVLSNRDIEKYLGKEIFIHPYSPDNMKGGSSYNLTASKFAYYCDDNGKHYAVNNGFIKIPAHTTVLIQTEESIYVSDKICGTYHSKVKLVSNGLSHIGTTLDPKYFGTSKIAVQNTSDKEQCIEVGSTFVSLMFYRLNRKATARHDNEAGRNDVVPVDIDNLKGINDIQKQEINQWINKPWRKNYESLIDITKKDKVNTTRGHRIRRLELVSQIVEFILMGFPLVLLFIHYFIVKLNFVTKILNNATALAIFIAILPSVIPIKNGVFKIIENNIRGDF